MTDDDFDADVVEAGLSKINEIKLPLEPEVDEESQARKFQVMTKEGRTLKFFRQMKEATQTPSGFEKNS